MSTVSKSVLVLLALIVALPLLAAPPYGDHPPGHRGGKLLPMLMHELELDEQQRQQIHEIFTTFHDGENDRALRTAGEAQRAVADAIHDPAATEEQIRAAVRAAGVAAEESALARHGLFMQIYDVLSEEQRAKLLEGLAASGEMPARRPPHGRRHGRISG